MSENITYPKLCLGRYGCSNPTAVAVAQVIDINGKIRRGPLSMFSVAGKKGSELSKDFRFDKWHAFCVECYMQYADSNKFSREFYIAELKT